MRFSKQKCEQITAKYKKNLEAIEMLITTGELNKEASAKLEGKAEVYKLVIEDLERIMYF